MLVREAAVADARTLGADAERDAARNAVHGSDDGAGALDRLSSRRINVMQIAVCCTSKSVDQGQLALWVDAWDKQAQEFCKTWGLEYRPVCLYATPDVLPPNVADFWLLVIEDNIDAPGAEGFHDDVAGVIFARCLPENNCESVPHEILEMLADPTCDQYKDIGDGSGRQIALEVCDPIEEDHYPQQAQIGDQEPQDVPVTNYVLPSYFDPKGTAPFDRMGKLTAPFSMDSGGYTIVRDAEGNTSDVFDQKLGGSSPTSWPPGALTDDRFHAGTVVERHLDGSIKEVVYGGPRIVGDEAGRARAEKKHKRPDSRVARRLAVKPRVSAPPNVPAFG